MPHRERADYDLILKTFEATQSFRETSRQTGYHYNTVRSAIRRTEGRCLRCHDDARSGKVYCTKCLAQLAEHDKERRRKKMRDGTCVLCDAPRSPLSRVHCEIHRQTHLDRVREHEGRKKTSWGNRGGQAAQPDRRIYNIRRNYGEAGVIVWQRLGGRCVLCGVEHRERSVNIHHIDGNHNRSVEENLTCLCYSCHKLVHLLTEHPNPQNALAWIGETYWTSPV